MRCVDLFCGAGGFSAGFAAAGIDVVGALDLWKPAVETHDRNHPEAGTRAADILATDPASLPACEVLIGSPPCTEFSFANRGGGGDIDAGLRLVYRFLRLVHDLRPRWWVMENVPRTLEFLPERVPLAKLGIAKKGWLEIPVRTVLVSADFGAPQKRARAFSGSFPIPGPTHFERPGPRQQRWRTLRDVLDALGDPEAVPPATVRDPVYGFELPAGSLTDHRSATLRLTDEEVRENRKAKADHSWYGRMAFPDELDRPARTVMATQLRVSRETTVVATGDGTGYRRLSVREMASVQGFPITYQFYGRTEALRGKLVGNAVAPPVAYAIAREILKAEGLRVPAKPRVHEVVRDPAPPVVPSGTRRRMLRPDRRFREHIPGSKVPGARVDIDNRGARPAANPHWTLGGKPVRHAVRWRTVLYRGGGKALRSEEVALDGALALLAREASHDARAFFADLAALEPRIPDATTLQAVRAERTSVGVTPYAILDEITDVVSRHFDAPSTAAFLVAAAFACEAADRGTAWSEAHAEAVWEPVPGAKRARGPRVRVAEELASRYAVASGKVRAAR